ncbi:MAG: 8-oxo-dGTP diphosphatase [Acidobacteriota bacterium]|nr:8-oxo-dGTP diphosphatase [Acidobacteriota bacterium]
MIHDGKILLIHKKRGLGAGKVTGPGGKLEPGEGAAACALREIHEELGVTAFNPEEVGELLFQFTDGYKLHVTVFRTDQFQGEAVETDEAIPLWTPLDAVPYDRMWDDDYLWVPLLPAGKRFVGRFVFEGETMLGGELV